MCFQCLFCLLKARSIEVFRQTEEIKWIHCRLKRESRDELGTWLGVGPGTCYDSQWPTLSPLVGNQTPFLSLPLLLFNTLTPFLLYFFPRLDVYNSQTSSTSILFSQYFYVLLSRLFSNA